MKRSALAAALAAGMACAGMASAATITDPAGDFYRGYTGPRAGDLDVLSASASLMGSNLVLGATVNGAVGTTPNWNFVWGINRGAGTPVFAASDPTLAGVVFDAVVSVSAAAQLVNLLVPAPPVPQPLPAGSVTIAGSSIEVVVPLSLLPSLGLPPGEYGINLWPRILGTVIPGVAGIADFAPNNSTFTVPEPASLALLAGGLLGLAGVRRRRP